MLNILGHDKAALVDMIMGKKKGQPSCKKKENEVSEVTKKWACSR